VGAGPTRVWRGELDSGMDRLDAVSAAPEHHRVLLENEFVRVLDTRIEPGQTTKLHTHQWPASHYVLSWSDVVRRDEQGNVTLDSRVTPVRREPGEAVWSGPMEAHTLENVGMGTVHIVSVEVKGAGGAGRSS